jgi:steroid 5-alpha reductase family enzyme
MMPADASAMLLPTLLIAGAALVAMMSILWVIGMKIHNAAVVDVGWGLGYVLVAVTAYLTIDGVALRQLVITALVGIWGLRLAWHLFADRIAGGKAEEGRYVDIRARWKTRLPLKFFLFYQVQALMILILSLPIYLISLNESRTIAPVELLGVLVWLIGVAGEATADAQLKRFKMDARNAGRTCRAGLWNYSRHPNYFFEWVIWLGYFLIGLAAPYGWLGAISPAAILYVLLRVTGIPLTEIQAVKSRGDDYREYQRTTSAFVPWFRKR